MMGPVDMKKKYKAKWALVTGAGTGIGKNINQLICSFVRSYVDWIDSIHLDSFYFLFAFTSFS